MQTKIGVAQSVYVVALLAAQENNKPLKSHVISDILRVSDSYLKKIIRKLVIAGILTSSASKRGGLSLKKSPEEITMLDIYQAIEGTKPLFNPSNIIDTFTRFHDTYFLQKGTQTLSYFAEAENSYKKALQSHTIAELLRVNDTTAPVVDLNEVTYNDLETGKIKQMVELNPPSQNRP